jgi:hypothetical protein
VGSEANLGWRHALQILYPSDEGSRWVPTIERLLDHLGGAGELLHLAPLEPRGVSRLRLTFHVAVETLATWLDLIDWPGERRHLTTAFIAIAGFGERLGVQLELSNDGTLGDYLGIETREFRSAKSAGVSMVPLLDAIASLAPLNRRLVEILPHWPGVIDDLTRHAYTKLVREDDGWGTKVYLGMTTPVVANQMRSATRRRFHAL